MQSQIKSIKNPYGISISAKKNEYFIIIPDIHGCLNELKLLIEDANQIINSINLTAKIFYIFLGDLIDRGPYSYETIEYVFNLKNAYVIMGNHEKKLLRKLEHSEVNIYEEQKWYSNLTKDQEQNILKWYNDVPVIVKLTSNITNFFFAHGAIEDSVYNISNTKFKLTTSQRDTALYGHTNGLKDPITGFPIRLKKPCPIYNTTNVYGHETHSCLNTKDWIMTNEPGTSIYLDHGGVHGGFLTSMIIDHLGTYFFLSHRVKNIYMKSKTIDYSFYAEDRRIIYG